jgi:hypothetical protein
MRHMSTKVETAPIRCRGGRRAGGASVKQLSDDIIIFRRVNICIRLVGGDFRRNFIASRKKIFQGNLETY